MCFTTGLGVLFLSLPSFSQLTFTYSLVNLFINSLPFDSQKKHLLTMMRQIYMLPALVKTGIPHCSGQISEPVVYVRTSDERFYRSLYVSTMASFLLFFFSYFIEKKFFSLMKKVLKMSPLFVCCCFSPLTPSTLHTPLPGLHHFIVCVHICT